jgi:Ca-activated chloride channel homolog
VSFSSPLVLLALVLIPLVATVAWWLDRRRSRYAVAFTNLDVLAAVASQCRRPWRRFVPLLLFLLALTSATAALARPRATISRPVNQATIVLLVDVSGSMRATDVTPTRLGAAQHAMSLFADTVPSNVRIGLVSFSSGANILVSPTTDRSVLHEGIDLLVPEAGTAIGDGLGVAVQVARSALTDASRDRNGKLPGAIILLSDGAQTRGVLTPVQGAERAKAAGIRVFTVALGTNHGTLPYGLFGGIYGGGNNGAGGFPVRPDPVTLAAIARDTGGQTFRATSSGRIDRIYRQLGASIAKRHASREVSSWFVGAAALLLLSSLGLARATGGRFP